ncbi:MAG: beta-ketoacyl synthase N-terminal-like domain-containing protein, partial [Planctomycetota bacterium]
LEHAWKALESAGYRPREIQEPVGVFAGCGWNRYAINNLDFDLSSFGVSDFQKMLNNDKDFLATRVAYKLNLKGPALDIQTACSTSLVTIQTGMLSLLTYQCDMAVCGGVCVNIPHGGGYLYSEGLIMSKDGYCRPFSPNANGTVFSEGVGVVVLKRYEDALEQGDSILAVIRGAAVNNDGADKVGYTAPSVSGQADVIELALQLANLSPSELDYIETHGTGTKLGDPIEMSALERVFGSNADTATKLGELVGTPAYMSPEQAEGKSIDGRADVFAIGAILFKLLTGTAPLPEPDEGTESLADIICHIRSFDAILPTRRLSQLEPAAQQALASRLGFTKSGQLASAIKGDLDWVTLRAIEPDKLRRYATADDFADDLERLLRNEPVLAAAPSRLYELRKLYERKKPTFLAAGAIAITLLLASLIGGIGWWNTRQQARLTFARISNEARGLLDDAEAARLRAANGGPGMQRESVSAQAAVAKVESLIKQQPGMADVERRLAETKGRIASDQRAIGFVKRLDDARERATQV